MSSPFTTAPMQAQVISRAPKPSGWRANRTTCASSTAVRRSPRCWRCARCGWNTRRRATKRSPTPTCSTCRSAFSPGTPRPSTKSLILSDGNYLFSGGQDGVARLWDVQTGQMIRVFAGHADAIIGVDISADSRYVATGSFDRTARIWDLQTGMVVHRLQVGGQCHPRQVFRRWQISGDDQWQRFHFMGCANRAGNSALCWTHRRHRKHTRFFSGQQISGQRKPG